MKVMVLEPEELAKKTIKNLKKRGIITNMMKLIVTKMKKKMRMMKTKRTMQKRMTR